MKSATQCEDTLGHTSILQREAALRRLCMILTKTTNSCLYGLYDDSWTGFRERAWFWSSEFCDEMRWNRTFCWRSTGIDDREVQGEDIFLQTRCFDISLHSVSSWFCSWVMSIAIHQLAVGLKEANIQAMAATRINSQWKTLLLSWQRSTCSRWSSMSSMI